LPCGRSGVHSRPRVRARPEYSNAGSGSASVSRGTKLPPTLKLGSPRAISSAPKSPAVSSGSPLRLMIDDGVTGDNAGHQVGPASRQRRQEHPSRLAASVGNADRPTASGRAPAVGARRTSAPHEKHPQRGGSGLLGQRKSQCPQRGNDASSRSETLGSALTAYFRYLPI
jgi:hypothetical protein